MDRAPQALGPLWPQEAVDGRRLIETYATLERKSVRIKAYEQQIKELEKDRESFHFQRLVLEKRIASLEHLVAELSKRLSGKQAWTPR